MNALRVPTNPAVAGDTYARAVGAGLSVPSWSVLRGGVITTELLGYCLLVDGEAWSVSPAGEPDAVHRGFEETHDGAKSKALNVAVALHNMRAGR